jgi:hypothetical protein
MSDAKAACTVNLNVQAAFVLRAALGLGGHSSWQISELHSELKSQ